VCVCVCSAGQAAVKVTVDRCSARKLCSRCDALIYTYICMYIYVCIYMYVCMYVCIYI
jgi:hypothetical protein